MNGEFGYLVLLGEFMPKREARFAAEGWGGDRYKLYEDKRTAALMLAQYTTWDSESEAKEFFDTYSERTEKRTAWAAQRPEARPRVYETNEGLAAIELRDKDVVIIEGARTAEELTRL